MKPLDIQYQLKLRGITQASIARELGVSEMHVSAVINKQRISDRVMKAVAHKIRRDHRNVFSEYYDGKENCRAA